MRAVLQRVRRASVRVDGQVVGAIECGWLVLLGVARDDSEIKADRLADKVAGLRAFEDDAGKMNRSVVEARGAILVVSQFTLLGDCRGGRRPSFTEAAEPAEADRLADKVAGLRAFEDDAGKMNRSVVEAGGAALVVSQFTLLGDCRAGRRPSFTQAADPTEAERLYQRFVDRLAALGIPVATGVFRALMEVELVNDGPVTLLLDSRRAF